MSKKKKNEKFLSCFVLFCFLFVLVFFPVISSNPCMEIEYQLSLYRQHDSSIGFGAPVRASMRTGGLIDAVVTSSILESVRP